MSRVGSESFRVLEGSGTDGHSVTELECPE